MKRLIIIFVKIIPFSLYSSGTLSKPTVASFLTGPVEVVSVKLISAPDGIDYTLNSGITAQPGQGIRIRYHKDAASFSNEALQSEPLAVSVTSSSFELEYASFGEGVIKQNGSAAEGEETQYSYSYYMIDHLGDTRMVVTGARILRCRGRRSMLRGLPG